jgi:peptidyl-prolyl cis-trans isomerase A (cyclophilin A)
VFGKSKSLKAASIATATAAMTAFIATPYQARAQAPGGYGAASAQQPAPPANSAPQTQNANPTSAVGGPLNSVPAAGATSGTTTTSGQNNFSNDTFSSPNTSKSKGDSSEIPLVKSEIEQVVPRTAKKNELRAILRTSLGDVTILLNRQMTPNTVSHFVGLAKGEKEFIDPKTSKRVKRPFYNGLTFHRVIKGMLVQTGCPFGNGRGGPGEIATIPDEIKGPMKFNRPGLVAMAPVRKSPGTETAKDTNGSQFFITLTQVPEWDDKYTIFGEVEDGLDIIQKISAVKVGPTERPIKRVYLLSVDIVDAQSSPILKPRHVPVEKPIPPAIMSGDGVPAQ